jgi:plasmid stabilization system protein ParE
MPRIILRPAAVLDIEAIYAWYESHREGLGEVFLRDLGRVHARLARHPESGSAVTQSTRRVSLTRFPYVVLHVVKDDHVLVTAVMHSHRHPRRHSDRVQERHVAVYGSIEQFVAA